jgi:alpha-D-ribose 1-methylphosphonate 5-triphosphate synthase subunit PhnI
VGRCSRITHTAKSFRGSQRAQRWPRSRDPTRRGPSPIDALELVQATDAVDLHVEVLLLLAELVDEPDAVQHRSAALALCEAKGDVVSSERVRRLL